MTVKTIYDDGKDTSIIRTLKQVQQKDGLIAYNALDPRYCHISLVFMGSLELHVTSDDFGKDRVFV